MGLEGGGETGTASGWLDPRFIRPCKRSHGRCGRARESRQAGGSRPRDITGSHAGVGLGQKPNPVFLKGADVMHLGAERLGEQRQRVIAWRHLGDAVLP
jgi:hypothetical protein